MPVIFDSKGDYQSLSLTGLVQAIRDSGFDSNPSPTGNVHGLLGQLVSRFDFFQLASSESRVNYGRDHYYEAANDVRLRVGAAFSESLPPSHVCQEVLLMILGILLMAFGGFPLICIFIFKGPRWHALIAFSLLSIGAILFSCGVASI
jgi:hypothetical protein